MQWGAIPLTKNFQYAEYIPRKIDIVNFDVHAQKTPFFPYSGTYI